MPVRGSRSFRAATWSLLSDLPRSGARTRPSARQRGAAATCGAPPARGRGVTGGELATTNVLATGPPRDLQVKPAARQTRWRDVLVV